MSKHKKWTTAEDKEVVDQVRKSPTNLKLAFKEAARVTGRSIPAVQYDGMHILVKSKVTPVLLQ